MSHSAQRRHHETTLKQKSRERMSRRPQSLVVSSASPTTYSAVDDQGSPRWTSWERKRQCSERKAADDSKRKQPNAQYTALERPSGSRSRHLYGETSYMDGWSPMGDDDYTELAGSVVPIQFGDVDEQPSQHARRLNMSPRDALSRPQALHDEDAKPQWTDGDKTSHLDVLSQLRSLVQTQFDGESKPERNGWDSVSTFLWDALKKKQFATVSEDMKRLQDHLTTKDTLIRELEQRLVLRDRQVQRLEARVDSLTESLRELQARAEDQSARLQHEVQSLTSERDALLRRLQRVDEEREQQELGNKKRALVLKRSDYLDCCKALREAQARIRRLELRCFVARYATHTFVAVYVRENARLEHVQIRFKNSDVGFNVCITRYPSTISAASRSTRVQDVVASFDLQSVLRVTTFKNRERRETRVKVVTTSLPAHVFEFPDEHTAVQFSLLLRVLLEGAISPREPTSQAPAPDPVDGAPASITELETFFFGQAGINNREAPHELDDTPLGSPSHAVPSSASPTLPASLIWPTAAERLPKSLERNEQQTHHTRTYGALGSPFHWRRAPSHLPMKSEKTLAAEPRRRVPPQSPKHRPQYRRNDWTLPELTSSSVASSQSTVKGRPGTRYQGYEGPCRFGEGTMTVGGLSNRVALNELLEKVNQRVTTRPHGVSRQHRRNESPSLKASSQRRGWQTASPPSQKQRQRVLSSDNNILVASSSSSSLEQRRGHHRASRSSQRRQGHATKAVGSPCHKKQQGATKHVPVFESLSTRKNMTAPSPCAIRRTSLSDASSEATLSLPLVTLERELLGTQKHTSSSSSDTTFGNAVDGPSPQQPSSPGRVSTGEQQQERMSSSQASSPLSSSQHPTSFMVDDFSSAPPSTQPCLPPVQFHVPLSSAADVSADVAVRPQRPRSSKAVLPDANVTTDPPQPCLHSPSTPLDDNVPYQDLSEVKELFAAVRDFSVLRSSMSSSSRGSSVSSHRLRRDA